MSDSKDNIVVMDARPKTETTSNEDAIKKEQDTVDNKQEVDNTETNKVDVGSKAVPKKQTSTVDKVDKVDEKNEKPSLNIDFGVTNDEKPINTNMETADNKQETVVVDQNSVIEYLRNNGFTGIKELSDLKQTLSEPVKKFQEFYDETGRGIKDFYNLQKDWKKESKENVVKEYLSLKYPDLSHDEIQEQYDAIKVPDEDEYDFSDSERRVAKANWNKTYLEALSFMTEKSKEYNVPLDSPKKKDNQQEKEAYERAIKKYWESRDTELNDLNEIKLNIKELGDIKITFDEDDKQLLSKVTNDVDSMIGRWVRDDKSINTKDLLIDNAWADRNIRPKLLTSIIEQVYTLTNEKMSKLRRNVDLDDLHTRQNNKQDINTAVVTSDSNILEVGNKTPSW